MEDSFATWYEVDVDGDEESISIIVGVVGGPGRNLRKGYLE
eukprot:CAMPEP_0197453470 /NCGR_PEP_ID=MMETSP1175-20131217/34991_1 /TAXON_ID=1003142 /ORGANISM="Triceratium dubium, Strain CCMP147" /LENGTH=40 /DNA_ID= /DNA_START= /DNA_END= /DNA_ORIENTATION=